MDEPLCNRYINPFEEHPWAVKYPQHASKVVRKSIIAGALASTTQICTMYPLEYVKVQLQLDTNKKRLYNGSIDCLQKTIKQHGLSGLYRGLGIMIVNGVSRATVRFGSWEYIKSFFINESGYLSPSAKLFSGLSAGVIEAVLTDIPTETIKTKIIKDIRSSTPQYRGIVHATKTIIKAEGFAGIFRGAWPTVCSLGIAQSIRFFIIETLSDVYKGNDPHKEVPNLFIGFSASIAGFISVFVTQPFDVIKTRFQGGTKRIHVLMYPKAKIIWQREGFLGFYRGTLSRLGLRVFGFVFTFMLYDAFFKVLDKVWVEEEI